MPGRKEFELEPDQMKRLERLLRKNGGPVISSYRQGCVTRRIVLRARTRGAQSLAEYIDVLRAEPGEVEKLKKALTIKVTSFFRNPGTFDTLHRKVLPLIFSKAVKEARKEVFILSLGCATGEEAYSVAILLKKYFSAQLKTIKASIVGYDIDEESLKIAREGIFDRKKVELIDGRTIKVGFKKMSDGNYSMRDDVKKMASFHQVDLFKLNDAPLSDIALARNSLIYFPREKQSELFGRINEAIRPEGFLVLGKTESVPLAFKSIFPPFNVKEKIFRKVSA